MRDFKYFEADLKKLIESQQIEVGIFNDATRKNVKAGSFKNFVGGRARQVSRSASVESNADVLKENQEKHQILTKPLKDQQNMQKLFERIFLYKLEGKKNDSRIYNDFLSVWIKPILRQQYGTNTSKTAKTKGFNRFLIDTGQMVKSITLRINKELIKK